MHLISKYSRKIVITGNERVSNETIKVYGDIEVNKNISESELMILIVSEEYA